MPRELRGFPSGNSQEQYRTPRFARTAMVTDRCLARARAQSF